MIMDIKPTMTIITSVDIATSNKMIDSKQFYIDRNATTNRTAWISYPLKDGHYIHLQEDLNIIFQQDGAILIGYAWQIDPQRQSPAEEMSVLLQKSDITTVDVFEIEKTWCGRYLLIVNNWIFLDAIGSLGVFYGDNTISSSLKILCEQESLPISYPKIEHGHLPDFFPGMQTPYPGIRRLLPSQIYNISKQQVITRPLLIDHFPQQKKDDYSTFIRLFENSIKQIYILFSDKNIEIALTGGRDSRALVALVENSNIQYNTFTLWHSHISDADIAIPAKIAKSVHRTHRLIKRNAKNYSESRRLDYQRHTAGMAVDEDWEFYSYGQYQQVRKDGKDAVILRSSIWEIACEYYTMVCGEKAQDIEYLFPGIKTNSAFRKSIEEWQAMVQEDKNNQFLTLVTRTFWDLREGCWLSSIEQSFDLMDGIISIQPLNSRLFLSLLMSFNLDNRKTKKYEEVITNNLCPQFATITYDYKYISRRVKIKRFGLRVKHFLQKLYR